MAVHGLKINVLCLQVVLLIPKQLMKIAEKYQRIVFQMVLNVLNWMNVIHIHIKNPVL